jgi:hypothetical protein
MAKLILLLMTIFSTLVPLFAASSKKPAKRTLRSLQIATVVVTFVWAYLCLTYYPQLVSVD